MKEENKAAFVDLSLLEVARRIAFLWTQMSQVERRVYYDRAGKHVDKSLSAKIRMLTADATESMSGDEFPPSDRRFDTSPEPDDSPKNATSDSHDSDEGDFVIHRRGGRRTAPLKNDQSSNDPNSLPRRRAPRRRRVFGAP